MCAAYGPSVKELGGTNALWIYRLSRDGNSWDCWRLYHHPDHQRLRLLGHRRRLHRARRIEVVKGRSGAEPKLTKPKFYSFLRRP
jgi:hypothetical protein